VLTPAWRRALVVASALLAPSGCSLLVSTDGLTGGGGDDGGPQDDTSIGLVDGSPAVTLGDALIQGDAEPTFAHESGADHDAPVDAPSHEDAPSHDAAPPREAGAEASADATTPSDGNPCSNDLSNVGTGSFHVSLDLRTTESGLAALVNQRASCTGSMFWDLRLSSGELRFETDDGASHTDVTSTGPQIDDGATHTILVTRVAEAVTIYVDGAASGSASSAASLGALPALATGTDPCEGIDGTAAFQGTISAVCAGAN
jgi:hypothetical protein